MYNYVQALTTAAWSGEELALFILRVSPFDVRDTRSLAASSRPRRGLLGLCSNLVWFGMAQVCGWTRSGFGGGQGH